MTGPCPDVKIRRSLAVHVPTPWVPPPFASLEGAEAVAALDDTFIMREKHNHVLAGQTLRDLVWTVEFETGKLPI